jgi:hypothetical protein
MLYDAMDFQRACQAYIWRLPLVAFVDLQSGPQVPQKDVSNWVETVPNRGWFAYFRLYGPEQAFFDHSWSP